MAIPGRQITRSRINTKRMQSAAEVSTQASCGAEALLFYDTNRTKQKILNRNLIKINLLRNNCPFEELDHFAFYILQVVNIYL